MAAPTLDTPLLLEPRLLEKPWGGRRMERVLRRALPPGVRIGESWECCDRGEQSSRVRSGRFGGRDAAGLTLAELRRASGDSAARPHPLLVKILDAEEPLSIQVHPDAAAAARLGGEPKTECWFVIDAEPGAKVWRGLREGVTRESLSDALRDGRIEDCLHSFEVRSGDTVFVPAGTVHTIGAGVLLAEVQQNSDTTYRLWDWGRPRELHVKEALASIHFGARGPDKVPQQVLHDDGAFQRTLLVQCRAFSAESIVGMGTLTLELESRVALPPGGGDGASAGSSPDLAPDSALAASPILHVLAGSGEVRPFRRGVPPTPFRAGDTLLLPPRDDTFEIATGADVVRALLFR